jgi:cysteinyl-tRNA synthetase
VVAAALEAFESVGSALGVLALSCDDFQAEVKSKRLQAMGVELSEIEQLLNDRTTARANKDWAAADAIRDALDEKHIVVMDRPGGVDWRVRL